MMARMKVATLDALEMVEQPFENDIDWQWALRHADAAERSVLSKMQHSRVMRLQAEIRMQHSEIQRGLQAMQTEQNRIYQQMLQMYEQKIQQDMASHHATMAELVECAGERAREREGLQEQQIRLQAAQMEIARREEELQHIRNAQQTESAGKARSSGDGKGFWTRLAMGMLSVAGSAVVLLGMLWCLLASPEKTQTIIFCFATMPWAVLGVNLFIMFLKDYEWSWLDLLSLLFAVPLLIAVILHIVTPPDSMPWLWIASAIFAVSGCFPWLGCGSDLRHLGADRGGNVNWAESVLMASAGAACPYCILMILQHLTGNALPHELLDVARCLIGVVPMCFAMAPYKGAKGPEST